MRISERVDNAVRAMGELAVGGTEPVKAELIANHQGMSLKYLLDILRDLKRAELVRSSRGPDGGFTLSRPAAEISLADVFRAVDGPLADVHDESFRGLESPAPAESLPKVWMAIRAACGTCSKPSRSPTSCRVICPPRCSSWRANIKLRRRFVMDVERRRSAAIEAVRAASELCTAAQGRLAAGDTLTKGDDSPVTVADFAAQAVVCATLTERLGALDLVGEEDASDLRHRTAFAMAWSSSWAPSAAAK